MSSGVERCRVGHAPYPNALAFDPSSVGVPDTTKLVWDFMKRFPLAGGAGGEWHVRLIPCRSIGAAGARVAAAPAVGFRSSRAWPLLEASAACVRHISRPCSLYSPRKPFVDRSSMYSSGPSVG